MCSTTKLCRAARVLLTKLVMGPWPITLVGEHAPPHPLGYYRRIGAKRAPILERYRSNFNPKGG